MNEFKLIALIPLLLTVGCGALTDEGSPYQKVSPESDKAAIYLYRPSALSGRALSPKVVCDEKVIQLSPGGYHRFVVPPGHVTCTSSYMDPGNNEQVDLDVSGGHDYYVKETIGMGFLVGRVHLALVDPDYGQGETQICKQQP